MFSIHKSTIEANENGLLRLLQESNKLYLLEKIQNNIHLLEPDEQDRVPLKLVTENIEMISEIVEEGSLGLKIIALIDLNLIPFYNTIKQSLRIVFEDDHHVPVHILLNLVSRYFSVITQAVSIKVEEFDQTIKIQLIPTMPKISNYHQIEGVALGLYRILKNFYPVKLSNVNFTHTQPKDSHALYLTHLNVIPNFCQSKNDIEFHIDRISGGVNQQAVTLFSSLQNLMDRQFPQTCFYDRCQHILMCILSFGEPTREMTSAILNMSVSSLQRQLKKEGYSFKDLLLNTRKKLAFNFLIKQKRNATDVAFLLGYESTSQFYKAFKVWFGMTPVQYQRLNGKL